MFAPQSQSLRVQPRASPSKEAGAEEGYSHDVAVSAITSFLTYVGGIYNSVDDSYCSLIYPPPEGWEAINRDNLAKLQENGRYMNGLTDRVIKLMRHIPYFTQNLPDLMVETHPADHLGRFTGSFTSSPETDEEREAAQNRIRQASEDYDQLVPPHMLVFTTGRQYRCYSILIDTERGAVRFWDREASGYPTEHPGDLDWDPDLDVWSVDDDSVESWKLARVYRIQTFFDLWKQEFRVQFTPIKSMRQEQFPLRWNANLAQNWNRELSELEERRAEDEEYEEDEDEDEDEE